KFKAIAGEDVLRAPLREVFDILPAAAVKKGDSWTRDVSKPMGPLGTFKVATTYAYHGLGDGGEQVATKGVFSFQPGKADPGELGLRIVKMELTKKEATGRLVFDNAKGRLVRQETTLPLAGTMTIEVMGMQIEVRLDGTETRTSRILAKRP